jgi:tRNA threonylcarbamoyladenosine biosynthesis protein TsaB
MNILALDTSTEACSVALLAGERVITRYQEAPRGHAELILPMVDALLDEAGVTLKDLAAIAFGRGPGSFTGVRLASSVVQGLAYGAGVGVVPVSTLQAVALRALRDDDALAGTTRATHVLVCNDARMDEVYVGAFARGAAESSVVRPMPLGPETVMPPAEVVVPQGAREDEGKGEGHGQGEAQNIGVRWIGAGRGFKAYPELSRLRAEQGGVLAAVHETILPRAEDILALAIPEVAAGRVRPPTAALPIYVRDEVATVPRAIPGSLSSG